MIQQSILRIITGQSVKRANLLKLLKEEGHQITDRILRKTVEEMVTKDGYCISSSDKGYHLIASQEEFEKSVSYLESKARAIAIRKNSLINNFRAQRGIVHNQTEMFI